MPQRLFPLRCHMNWDAGAGCGPAPSPTARGCNLPELSDDPSGCLYLLHSRALELMCRTAGEFLSCGTKAALLGLGVLGKTSRQAAWTPSGSPGITYDTAGQGDTVYCRLWALRTALPNNAQNAVCHTDQTRCNRRSETEGWRGPGGALPAPDQVSSPKLPPCSAQSASAEHWNAELLCCFNAEPVLITAFQASGH